MLFDLTTFTMIFIRTHMHKSLHLLLFGANSLEKAHNDAVVIVVVELVAWMGLYINLVFLTMLFEDTFASISLSLHMSASLIVFFSRLGLSSLFFLYEEVLCALSSSVIATLPLLFALLLCRLERDVTTPTSPPIHQVK